MVDREKVIKGLKCCLREIERADRSPCFDCPYADCVIGYECTDDLKTEALALLKEQEAVDPYQHDSVWLCGNCEKEVVGWDDDIDGKEYRYPFCRQCGRPVKWE